MGIFIVILVFQTMLRESSSASVLAEHEAASLDTQFKGEEAPINHVSISFSCHNKTREARIELRGGKYWVLYNYIQASKERVH